ncbi:MAG: ABC transporter permease subunit [Chitinophagales bacterium]
MMLKISKYIVYDILRSKVLLTYSLFLILASFALFYFESDNSKSLVSLLSVVQIMVPLISIIFTTTYIYNASEFMELLVAQPLSRNTILLGVFTGIAISMTLAVFLGIGIPVMVYEPDASGFTLLGSAIALTLIFTSLAFFSAVAMRDKVKGVGLSLMLWFYFAVIYDAIVLAVLFAFNDYPLETVVLVMASLNPIDLARILVLMQLDISALMGFTGAVYKQFFGTSAGISFVATMLNCWILLPLLASVWIFKRKNL